MWNLKQMKFEHLFFVGIIQMYLSNLGSHKFAPIPQKDTILTIPKYVIMPFKNKKVSYMCDIVSVATKLSVTRRTFILLLLQSYLKN